MVHPNPPELRDRGTIASAIISQNPVRPRISCLITSVIISNPTTYTLESAHSLDPLVLPSLLIVLGGVEALCRERAAIGVPCTLHHGFRLLPDD